MRRRDQRRRVRGHPDDGGQPPGRDRRGLRPDRRQLVRLGRRRHPARPARTPTRSGRSSTRRVDSPQRARPRVQGARGHVPARRDFGLLATGDYEGFPKSDADRRGRRDRRAVHPALVRRLRGGRQGGQPGRHARLGWATGFNDPADEQGARARPERRRAPSTSSRSRPPATPASSRPPRSRTSSPRGVDTDQRVARPGAHHRVDGEADRRRRVRGRLRPRARARSRAASRPTASPRTASGRRSSRSTTSTRRRRSRRRSRTRSGRWRDQIVSRRDRGDGLPRPAERRRRARPASQPVTPAAPGRHRDRMTPSGAAPPCRHAGIVKRYDRVRGAGRRRPRARARATSTRSSARTAPARRP